jgi:microcystin-dependent protein
MNIDLNNCRTLTILVIVVLIVFAIVYICMNRDGFGYEGFINYPVAVGDVVQLQGGLSNVQVGSDNTPLPISINNLIQQSISNLVPALTVVSYFGNTAPTGWQLCDGKSLKDTNGNLITGSDGNVFYTPNLQGRVIVGTTLQNNSQTPLKDQNGNVLEKYNLGRYSGEEKHVLTNPEMPSHSHPVNVASQGSDCGGDCPAFGTTTYSKLNADKNGNIWQAYASNVGGNQPHNNMQPFYVLSYIIKQPIANANNSSVNLTIANSNAVVA